MKQSKLFTKTSKTLPKDEVSLNSQLLLKSGFIDKKSLAPILLPLGHRVLNKIINIIREEMNAIDGQEIMLTALQAPPPGNRPTAGTMKKWTSGSKPN